MLQKIDPEEKHLDILLIDKFERFEQLPAGFKLIADSGLYDELSVPFVESVKSFKSQRVEFKQGLLLGVDSKANTVEIQLPKGGCETVKYDALILATGASYVAPWRGADNKI